MPKIGDWEVTASPEVKLYPDEKEITAMHKNEVIARLRFTPRGVFTIDSKECTIYIKPETKSIEISFIRGL